jgi:Fe-S-cluster containining protein
VDCTRCGACCAFYRVDFHRLDGDDVPGGFVPVAWTLPLNASLLRMRGTDAFPPRCVALCGDLGQRVSCAIYAERPGPCRELEAGSQACIKARRRYGVAERPVA